MRRFPRKSRLGNEGLRVFFCLVVVVSILVVWKVQLGSWVAIDPSYSAPRVNVHQAVGDPTNSLPEWMQKYLQWHRRRLLQMNYYNISWLEQPLLVLRCVEDDRCGGTADRLKSLPLFLALAAKTNRMLFLRWNRPFALEEFMVPGRGMNWTVPTTLAQLLSEDSSVTRTYFGGKALAPLARSAHDSQIWLVEGAAQLAGGNLFRDIVLELQEGKEPVEEPPSLFHNMFHSLFQPSPSLRVLLERYVAGLKLQPNEFSVLHYRAKYPGEPFRDSRNESVLEPIVVNAVECTARLHQMAQSSPPGTNVDSFPTVYVASDAFAVLQAAQRNFPAPRSSRQRVHVVTHLDVPRTEAGDPHSGSETSHLINLPLEDPPHLNFAKVNSSESFFSIFVDLFVMSYSRCVSFGAGGFGRFGSLVSHNVSCRAQHSLQGELFDCSSPLPP